MSAPRCDVSPWLLPRERDPDEPDDRHSDDDFDRLDDDGEDGDCE